MSALEDTVCPALLADIDRQLCMMLTGLERMRGQAAIFNLSIALKLDAQGGAEIRWKGKRKLYTPCVRASADTNADDGGGDD